MGSRFDREIGTGSSASPQGRPVDIDVDCQYPDCYEEGIDVTYYPMESVLKYTCPNGHKNFIENFGVPL